MALDEAQSKAAACDAPIQLTLAGPGSGKTTTLVARFLNLVESGVDPRKILAMTFTRKAADEMRDRVWSLSGQTFATQYPGLRARDLSIATFHSFALAELRREAAATGGSGLAANFTVLADKRAQRAVFIKRDMWWRESGDVIDMIGQAKERLLNAAAFAREIREDPERCSDRAWTEAARYFEVYEKALRDAGAVDFSDFVPRLVSIMDTTPAAREDVTCRFEHLLVDEYQDVNPGQALLIDRFVEDGVRLWAVGDDDQTLYSFRASDVRHILRFEAHYRERFEAWKLAKAYEAPISGDAIVVHRLGRNYRSHAAIVDAGQRIIEKNTARLGKPLKPSRPDISLNDPVNRVAIFGYDTAEAEAQQIALAVKKLLGRGVPPEEIAILYRVSSISHHLAVAMVSQRIPFCVRGGGDLWQSQPARLLRGGILYAFEGETARVRSIMGDSAKARSLRATIGDQKLEAFSSIDRIAAKGLSADARLFDEASMVSGLALSFSKVHLSVAKLLQVIFPKASGGSRGDPDDSAAFEAASAFIKTFGSLEAMETGIRELSTALEDKPKGVVVLSTIHKAKGLEWDWLFIPGWEVGIMPHGKALRPSERAKSSAGSSYIRAVSVVPMVQQKLDEPLSEEEERRVAYVGVTRARLGLTLTYSGSRNGEKTVPSPYLRDLTVGQRYGYELSNVATPRSDNPDPEILIVKPKPGVRQLPLTRSMTIGASTAATQAA